MSQENTRGLHYWHTIVIMLCFGWTAIWIYRTVLTPIYTEIQASIGSVSNAELGAIASFYFFSYTGMQIPSGILVDKFGQKAVLIPGFILFALAAFVIGSADGLKMIYLGSLMAGLGTGAYYGSAYSLSGANIPQASRTFSNAIINSGSAVGMAFGLIGSSLLVKSLGLKWNIMLYIIGGIILVAAFVFAVFIKSGGKTGRAATASGPSSPIEEEEDASGKTTLFSLESISSYVLYFATCYGYYMLVTWLPNFLETERGFTGVAIGMSAALVAFSSIPGALFFSRKADRFRNRRNSLICALEFAAAGVFVFIVMAPSSTLLMAGLIIYGLLGKLAVDPILISHVIDHAPKKRTATHLTTFNFFGMSSSVVAPLVTGLISDTFHSKAGGFYLAMALLLVATLFFLLVNNKKR
jgi:MFS family permease